MIKINCTSCHKPLSIDETKLPMKEVSFPCPSCKTKLKIDRRRLAAPTPVPTPEPEAAAGDEEDELREKALLIGTDSPQARQALKTLGRHVVHFPSSAAARDVFLQEYPTLVVFNAGQVGAPPIADMAPMLQLSAVDRRKGFFVLVADNLRTSDGNAAFLYNVNLVVASKDVGSLSQIYKDAITFHERLYVNIAALAG